MDVEKSKILEVEVAYLAGFFDGEGSIFISTEKHNSCPHKLRHHLTLRISNTNSDILHLLFSIFKVGVVKKQPTPEMETKGWTQDWVWVIVSRGAVNLLEMMLPYLKVKKKQAELAIKFQSLLMKNPKGHSITVEEFIERGELRNKIKELNHSRRWP